MSTQPPIVFGLVTFRQQNFQLEVEDVVAYLRSQGYPVVQGRRSEDELTILPENEEQGQGARRKMGKLFQIFERLKRRGIAVVGFWAKGSQPLEIQATVWKLGKTITAYPEPRSLELLGIKEEDLVGRRWWVDLRKHPTRDQCFLAAVLEEFKAIDQYTEIANLYAINPL